MADGPVANLPAGLDAYAGYVDDSGIGVTYPGVVAKFPNALHLSIATHGAPAMCADCESGAMTSWAGYTYGYCAVSNVNNFVARFGRPVKLWTAHYDPNIGAHICSPACWPGLVTTADGTQWTDHGGVWDESLLADDFFGTAPTPTPSPPLPEGLTVMNTVLNPTTGLARIVAADVWDDTIVVTETSPGVWVFQNVSAFLRGDPAPVGTSPTAPKLYAPPTAPAPPDPT